MIASRLAPLACAVALAGSASSQTGAASFNRPSDDLLLGALAYDEPGDGRLWALGRDYKASFGPEGATFVPFLGSKATRTYPVHLRLGDASLGGEALALNDVAERSQSGDTVTLSRGPVAVRYHLSPDSVEQTFVLEELPRRGDLHLRVAVESELAARAETSGGFLFEGDRGGVSYGRVTVLDGAGRSLAVPSRLEAGDIVIDVPGSFLADATLPVIVDPVIKTYNVNTGSVDTLSGEVAYDPTWGIYYHAYVRVFAQNDHDVFAAAYDFAGNLMIGSSVWIDLSSEHWRSADIANNEDATNFLVVSVVGEVDAEVFGREILLPAATVGSPVRLSAHNSAHCKEAVVSGGADGEIRFAVAWITEEVPGVQDDIHFRALQANFTSLGSVNTIDDSPNTRDEQLAISKSRGRGPWAQRVWTVAWKRVVGSQGDVWAARMAYGGQLVGQPFAVASTVVLEEHPAVSVPLDAPAGGPADYVITYEEDHLTHRTIKGAILKRDELQFTHDLAELDAIALGVPMPSRSSASIATDGANFLVSYSECDGIDPCQIFVSTYGHAGHLLVPIEPHLQISTGAGDHYAPRIVSAFTSGIDGWPVAALTWTSEDALGDFDTLGAIYATPPGWGSIGEVICEGDQNSSGSAATMRIVGSPEVALNRVFFDVDNLPPNQWGLWVMSLTTAQIPLGDGTLCLGAPQIRLQQLITNSLPVGSTGAHADLTAFPPAGTVVPNDTWYFQMWFRDGQSTNLSNAVRLTFE